MPDSTLESALERSASEAPPPPPAAFLSAVRSRGRRRKVFQAAYALGLAVAAWGLTLLLVRPPDAVDPTDDSLYLVSDLQPESIASMLARGVPDPGAAAESELLRLGQRRDPEDVLAWVGG